MGIGPGPIGAAAMEEKTPQWESALGIPSITNDYDKLVSCLSILVTLGLRSFRKVKTRKSLKNAKKALKTRRGAMIMSA